jgi:hypothetical protein
MSINNLEFFHHLLFDLGLVKISAGPGSAACDNILQFTIIVDLQPTNLKSIDAYINALDFLHKFNCHVFVIQAILYLVARYLQEFQVAVNAVVLDIYATFYI